MLTTLRPRSMAPVISIDSLGGTVAFAFAASGTVTFAMRGIVSATGRDTFVSILDTECFICSSRVVGGRTVHRDDRNRPMRARPGLTIVFCRTTRELELGRLARAAFLLHLLCDFKIVGHGGPDGGRRRLRTDRGGRGDGTRRLRNRRGGGCRGVRRRRRGFRHCF